MIVTLLKGGLGNQMFQYATGKRLAKVNNTKLFICPDWLEEAHEGVTKRVYELDSLNVDENLIKRSSFVVAEPDPSVKVKVYRYTKGLLKPRLQPYAEKGLSFDKQVLKLADNTFLDGFWQNEKYFRDIRGILLKEFEPKTEVSAKNHRYLENIRSCESISLHIRRGDYISNPEAKKFHGLTPLEYYHAAFNKIRNSRKGQPLEIFVFSTDLDWCRKNLKFDCPVTFVEGNKKGADDMRLMKNCKHNILANSSFSWWGAWLNQNPNKIVIAPKIWFLDEQANREMDNIPKEWVRL
jgi:hypothetical protein